MFGHIVRARRSGAGLLSGKGREERARGKSGGSRSRLQMLVPYCGVESLECRLLLASGTPENPVLLGGCATPDAAWGLAVAGTTAYIADHNAGLQIIDISNPTQPVLLGGYDTPAQVLGVAVSGTRAYLADSGLGLKIVDVSNPKSPSLLGSYNTGGSAYGVAVVGDRAYIAYSSRGLVIVDVSNPKDPKRLGECATGGSAKSVEVIGTRAYVAAQNNGLVIIDVSNPASPVKLGGIVTSNDAWDVDVVGNRAYLADNINGLGLSIVDISNPGSPALLGRFSGLSNALGVRVVGDYAYVAAQGLQVINVSDPAYPARVGGYDTAGYSYGLQVRNGLVFLADGSRGLQIIDVGTGSGDLDPAFGNQGIVLTPVSGFDHGFFTAVAQQGSKIVAGGHVSNQSTGAGRLGLARYNADGSLDQSFGNQGTALFCFSEDRNLIRNIFIQADGSILVVALADFPNAANEGFDTCLALCRFTADGSFDAGFGNGGFVLHNLSEWSPERGVQQGDGSIIVPVSSGQILRLRPDGSQDESFNCLINGFLPGDMGIAAGLGGSIYVSGMIDSGGGQLDWVLARIRPDGQLSGDWPNGIAHLGATRPFTSAVRVLPDSRIVVGGIVQPEMGRRDLVLTCVTPSGAVNTLFGVNGVVSETFSELLIDDDYYCMAVQPDGRIVTAVDAQVRSTDRWEPLLLRYNSDGTRDQSFGSGGIVATTESQPAPGAVLIQEDGNILVAGGTDHQWALARYLSGSEQPVDDHADAGDWSNASAVSIDATTFHGRREGNIEAPGDSDLFVFHASRAGAVITCEASIPGSRLRVYNSAHQEVASSSLFGSTRISLGTAEEAGEDYYILVDKTDWTTGSYTLTVDEIGISLPNGASITPDASRQTWVVIHGRNDDPWHQSWMAGISKQLAKMSDRAKSPKYTVLVVDWSRLSTRPGFLDFTGERWILPVAQAVSARLKGWGYTGTRLTNLNLVGHSWGGVMTAEVAKRMEGKVNRLIALDPARDSTGIASLASAILNRLSGLPSLSTKDRKSLQQLAKLTASFTDDTYSTESVNFRQYAIASRVFVSSALGSQTTAVTAHDSFIIADAPEVSWLSLDGIAHNSAVGLFANMLKAPQWNASSNTDKFFGIDTMASATKRTLWKRDVITKGLLGAGNFFVVSRLLKSGFEGVIDTEWRKGSPFAKAFRYVPVKQNKMVAVKL